MKFTAKVRQVGQGSIGITIPTVVIEGLEIKIGDIATFDIEPIEN